jgi:hypothetical protein
VGRVEESGREEEGKGGCDCACVEMPQQNPLIYSMNKYVLLLI